MDLRFAAARALNGIAAPLPLPAPRSLADFRRMVAGRAPQIYRDFYARWAPFDGRDVAEIGAGWGYAANCYLSIGDGPRHYYALDVAHTDAIEAECCDNPRRERLSVVRIAPGALPLPDECVDVVISENTFEHALEYPKTIAESRRILRTGGRLAALFAPLYRSPYGAHLWHVVKFPWLHLMFDEATLRRLFYAGALPQGLEYDHDYHWEQFATLNRLRPDEFLAPFRAGGWELVSVVSYPIANSHRAPEPLRSLFTHGMRIVAKKT